MKKALALAFALYSAVVVAQPASVTRPELMMSGQLDITRVLWMRADIRPFCYITGYSNGVETMCRGVPRWNPEVQALFNSIDPEAPYTNAFGIERTLRADMRDGLGLGPWVRRVLLPEYERRGVRPH